MTTSNPKTREDYGANFVYHNKRLFIGWRVAGKSRVGAWLGTINTDGATDEHRSTNPITTDRLRVYAYSNGYE